ncbi:MAG TPA: peptidoglycan-associated lipoprotein Pal [Thermodesulfovibrionales bacterium]|nr:peptidoglycan-associated lipoprotein Pal [Thermodesulfovibrionales bacterium]
MRKIVVILSLILSVFIFAGCPPQKVVQPTPAEQQEMQAGSEAQESAKKLSGTKPSEHVSEKQLARIESKEEPSASQYKEVKDLFEDIYFDYDEYQVKPAAKSVLQKVANWLLLHRGARVAVEGHCDERGTNEYNLALGDRRAKSVRDYLVALGVPSGRIDTISYGEEKPVCSDKTEACFSKNRRVHFVILKEAGK